MEVASLGRLDALFVDASIDNPDLQFDPASGLQTDFTAASGSCV